MAKSKAGVLIDHIGIAECGKYEAALAIANKKVHDLEDGLQYYAALHAKCDCIVTSDVDDFYFSEIEVLTPEEFFRKHVVAD